MEEQTLQEEPGGSEPIGSTPAPRSRAALGTVITVLVVAGLVLGLGFANVVPGFHLRPGGTSSTPTPAATKYNVTFTESGLGAGTTWSVTLGGSLQSSSTTAILFTDLNGSYAYTVSPIGGYSMSPSSGTITVAGQDVGQGVSFTVHATRATYNVTFSESGLPTDLQWTLTLNHTTQLHVTSSITLAWANGTYLWQATPPSGFSASPSSGSVHVSGAAVHVQIAFSAIARSTYSANFTETGLAPGASWSVTLNGTTTPGTSPSSIGFSSLPNGTYAFSVVAAGYSANPSSGSVTVSGNSVTQPIAFTVEMSFSGLYDVSFAESGLSVGTQWGVMCGVSASAFFFVGDEGATNVVALPNGSYAWAIPSGTVPGYIATPTNGSFTVNGGPVVVTVTFATPVPTVATYSVTFTERGLPGSLSQYWSVTLGSTSKTPTGNSIVFSEPNGSYNWSLGTPANFVGNPFYGFLIVDGSSVRQAITFDFLYMVTFSESGLAGGTTWSVGVNYTYCSGFAGSSPCTLELPNGTQPFFVQYLAGYLPTPVNGSVTVAGANVTRSITFSPDSFVAQFKETGLPVGAGWWVDLAPNADPGNSNTGIAVAGTGINLSLPVGAYSWDALSFNESTFNGIGYFASPADGTIQQTSGASVAVTVHFVSHPKDHLVEFEQGHSFNPLQGGLPAGANWSVTLNGTTVGTGGGYVLLVVPNGTYTYTITAPSGYLAAPAYGTLTVNDANPFFLELAAYIVAYFGPTTGPLPPHLSPSASTAPPSDAAAPTLAATVARAVRE